MASNVKDGGENRNNAPMKVDAWAMYGFAEVGTQSRHGESSTEQDRTGGSTAVIVENRTSDSSVEGKGHLGPNGGQNNVADGATRTVQRDGGVAVGLAAPGKNLVAANAGTGARDSLIAVPSAHAKGSSPSTLAMTSGTAREHEETVRNIAQGRELSGGGDSLIVLSDGKHMSSDSLECAGTDCSSITTPIRAVSVGSGDQIQPTNSGVEQRKRNRAERLGQYVNSKPSESKDILLMEVETLQWIDSLRLSAFTRGESGMAAFALRHQAAAKLREKQAQARAYRTADISRMEDPDRLLHCAVLKGDHALATRTAQFLVDNGGANVNSRDEWGRTPLHTASWKGIVSLARFFVRRGANVDARDNDNRSPLYFACAGGHVAMVRYLTRPDVGARLDLRDSRGHLAGDFFWDTVSQETQAEIMQILLAAGWPNPPPPLHDRVGRKGLMMMKWIRRASVEEHRRSRSEQLSTRPSRIHDVPETEGAGDERKWLATEMESLLTRR